MAAPQAAVPGSMSGLSRCIDMWNRRIIEIAERGAIMNMLTAISAAQTSLRQRETTPAGRSQAAGEAGGSGLIAGLHKEILVKRRKGGNITLLTRQFQASPSHLHALATPCPLQ